MKKKGYALIVVLIVMGLTFAIASLMLKFTINKRATSLSNTNDIKAYYCAETGVYDMINYIIKNNYTINDNPIISNNYSNNNILFNDSSALYEATLNPLKSANINELYISKNVSGNNTVNFNFIVKSIGTYSNNQYTLLANITIYTVENPNLNTYKYKNHIINEKIIYPSFIDSK